MSNPRIMLVGEAWGQEEERLGKPFVGKAGNLLHSLLRSANIDETDCYFTNVFNFRPPDNKLAYLAARGGKPNAVQGLPMLPTLGRGIWIDAKYQPELDRLYAEVNNIRPNVIVALGVTPLWALTRETKMKENRGTPLEGRAVISDFKVLPTYHPAAVLRKWSFRPIVIADLRKAAREAEYPEIRRPSRTICIPETIDDLWEYKNYYMHGEVLSTDIETKAGTITEIGFAPSPSTALVVPFLDRRQPDGNYWRTLEEELAAWRFVFHILKSYSHLGQNFNYDLQYLHAMGAVVPRLAGDTMILHHALYPELEKGLGFQGSLYTDEPQWKMMRTDNDKLKAED